MNKTNIEWCDISWNPVTGCLHTCEYCYARRITHRFKGYMKPAASSHCGKYKLHDLDKPYKKLGEGLKYEIAPYPFDFEPTFHRYRLNEPQRKKKPQTIFVCSMADLFGEWVPDAWIEEVFKSCAAAPQHRYLFLTKNPKRYTGLSEQGILPRENNYWFGATATSDTSPFIFDESRNTFVSIEPILGSFREAKDLDKKVKWIIIGAQTGTGKKVIPKREWIENIVATCRSASVPVFMKDSLIPIIGEGNMLREFPWEVKA
jgi:protein gp37